MKPEHNKISDKVPDELYPWKSLASSNNQDYILAKTSHKDILLTGLIKYRITNLLHFFP